VVGGHINKNVYDKGNVFSVPSNHYAEFNMFLDPLAAKIVFQSEVNITLIPLNVQHKASSFSHILCWLRRIQQTPEVVFSKRVLLRLQRLKKSHHRYQHMVYRVNILSLISLSYDTMLLLWFGFFLYCFCYLRFVFATSHRIHS